MALNKSALHRYRIIDDCLTNRRHRFPSKSFLREKIEEKLGFPISNSMLEKDIAAMRSDQALNYQAPIAYCKTNKGYYYADKDYSISRLALSADEWETLRNVSALVCTMYPLGPLRDFKELVGKIDRLCSIGIDVETEDDFQNLMQVESRLLPEQEEWVNACFRYTKEKEILRWKQPSGNEYFFHPYAVREKDKNWFFIGWCPEKNSWMEFSWQEAPSFESTGCQFQRRRYFTKAG